MQNVILVIHILACLAMIGLVLVQQSEGGGLGIGGGGGDERVTDIGEGAGEADEAGEQAADPVGGECRATVGTGDEDGSADFRPIVEDEGFL